MSAAGNDDQRWQALADLEALGVPLDDDDAAFFAEYAAAHPECAAEAEAWDDLLHDLRSPTASVDEGDEQAFVASLLATYRAGQSSTGDPEENSEQEDAATDEAHEPHGPHENRTTPLAMVHSLPSRSRWPLLAVGALAAAAALALVLFPDDPTTGETPPPRQAEATSPPKQAPVPSDRPSPPKPEPVRAPDSALIALSSPGGITINGQPAATGSRITEGATLTAQTETCVVFDAPFASVCLGPGTSASLRSAHDGDRLFDLERGALVATLDKIPEGHAFTVMADGYRARAVGTVFSVRIADKEAELGVFEGIVELRGSEPSASPARSLEELQHTRFSPSSEVRALPADLKAWSRDRSALAELWRGLNDPSQLHLGASSAALSVDGRSLGDTYHDLPAGLDLLVSAGEHRLDVRTRSGAKSHVVSASPAAPVVLTSNEIEPPRAATRGKTRPITAATAGPSIAELRDQASDARATRSWRDAKAAYEELLQRYPDAPEALNARVQLGDILRRRLGQPAAALIHFDAYISHGGPLAAEARFGRVLALQQLGRRADEALAIADFLGQHPKHIEAENLRARARELAEP